MSSREVQCACGAINDVTLTSCIRCGQPLGRAEAPAPKRQALAGAGTSMLLLGGLCTVVFAAQLAFQLRAGGGIPLVGGDRLVAFRLGMLHPSGDVLRAEPFRLLSAVYVHFGLLHFGLNMLGLFSQSRLTDRIVGSSRTIIAFVVGGVVGYLTTYALQRATGAAPMDTAGASGGLLAVMGVVLGVMRRRKMPGFITQAGNVLFYVVLFGLAVNATQSSIMINNAAHVGGLVCGFVLGYAWGDKRDAGGSLTRGAAIVLFLASIASVVLALSSNMYELVGTTGTRQ